MNNNNKNANIHSYPNDKLSSKYMEINKVKELLLDIKEKLADLKKEYTGFDGYVKEIINDEISGELNIYLENK